MSDQMDKLTAQQVNEILFECEFEDLTPTLGPNLGGGSERGQNQRQPLAAASASNRFDTVDQEHIMKFIGDQAKENTVRKTESDVRLFKTFLESQNEFRSPEELPPVELDFHFGNFLVAVKKKDGSDYEPSSVRGFLSSLDRHLKMKYYAHTVNQNALFPHTNQALKAKMSYLKKNGGGNRPNESDELTDEDIDKLFDAGELGHETPQQVINLLHVTFSLVLGMRGGVEQRALKWGDIELLTDADGDEYLEHRRERNTKTRTGADYRNIRKFKPKAWATADKSRCPVEAYKVYRAHRPTEMNTEDSPFFLSINALRKEGSNQLWYKNMAMGKNQIYKLTKNMVGKAGVNQENQRKLTNHSVRKHQMQKCVDMGLPPTATIQLSGHKNLQSVNNYSKLNDQQQKKISLDLMTTGAKPTSISTNSVSTINDNDSSYGKDQPEKFVQTFSSQVSNDNRQHAMASSIFSGPTRICGGTINIFTGPAVTETGDEPAHKYRRITRPLEFSDSDSD